jgi:hypothetical protein
MVITNPFMPSNVSEESGGGLDNWEQRPEMRKKRKDDIVNFFKEFKAYCNALAPDKPIMLATNSLKFPTEWIHIRHLWSIWISCAHSDLPVCRTVI